MQDERMSGALQENVLTLLCFNDDACKVIRNNVSSRLFESSVYRDIASHAIDYIDQFGEAVKEHLPDVLEHILKGNDKRKSQAYERVLDNLFEARNHINAEYVVSKINHFVRGQSIKSAIVKAVEAIERDDIDEAEIALTKGLEAKAVSFEPGIIFSDTKNSLKFFDEENVSFTLGISELDKRNIGPARKEMLLFVAPPKKGKSWGLIHAGKHALLQRLKVLHITLEMSEDRVSQRYVQSFFSVSKREGLVKTPQFMLDQLGRLIDIDYAELTRPSLADANARSKLASKIKRDFTKRPPLIIKQFPTGTLTISQLKAYLDTLERTLKFVPDVLIMDYPDLMALDSSNVRGDTSQIFKQLRGTVVERNMALVAATQGNRASAGAKVVTDMMVAEDFSKIATADNVITYSQTDQEHKLGLARLFVSNGRNDEDKFMVLISQSYAIGQFCLDSTLMLSDYWSRIDRVAGSNRRESDEDDD